MTDDVARRLARTAWQRFEPVHAVTYFAPEAKAAYADAGLTGYWRGYFAGRAAPLGPVSAGPVTAICFGFAPGMVRRALPDVWSRATPAAALDARREGAGAALRRLLADADAGRLARAAALARRAAESADVAGRPLAAANQELPWPAAPVDQLWHACTILREHRGDGHVAALTTAGVDGCASLVWRVARHGDREALQPHRGWTDEEWDAARDRLAAAGWLTADGALTPRGLAAHRAVEDDTDRIAAGVWRALGDERSAELLDLLAPLAAVAAGSLPWPNPIGLPTPGSPPAAPPPAVPRPGSAPG